MRWIKRHRTLFLFLGSMIAFAASYFTDPDNGLSTGLAVVGLAQGIWAIWLAHWGRKAIADYREADQRMLFAKASESPEGAGLALIALAIIFVGLLFVFSTRAHADELPAGFAKYGPTLKVEQKHYWPGHPQPYLLAGLVEQESCASLRSSSCWSPTARLKSAREEGAGLGQVTRAYRADGSIRFDALASMRAQYSSELGEWSWGNVYSRPDLQLRAIVLMSRDAESPFRAADDSLKFGDAAYNGGVGGVQKERRACSMTPGCDPVKWFGNVELHCLKSRQPLYGGRSACDINREHVHKVFLIRSKKYEAAWVKM